jgi:branched-chain amino acid transport system substrate-binding protein
VALANGGKIVGGVKVPLNTPDFSSFLLQAKNSWATTIALALAGADLTNAIKQANEFRVADGGQNLAAMLSFISDVNAMGLSVAQGIVTSESFYWDLNDQTRQWSRRFMEKLPASCPIWFTPEPILRFCITSAVSLLPERSTPPSSSPE